MVFEAILQFAQIVAQTDFTSLAVTTLFFFGVAAAVWLMYNWISTRDIFKSDGSRPLSRAMHLCKYIIILPAWTVMWFTVYAVLLTVLAEVPVPNILLGSVMIVAGIRIAAYMKSDFANDVASILPVTLLAAIMFNPSFITPQTIVDSAVALASNASVFVQYVVFLLCVEWALRLTLWGRERSREILNGRYLLPFGRIFAPRALHESPEAA